MKIATRIPRNVLDEFFSVLIQQNSALIFATAQDNLIESSHVAFSNITGNALAVVARVDVVTTTLRENILTETP